MNSVSTDNGSSVTFPSSELAQALNDLARIHDEQARTCRRARDTEIRRLYALGMLPHEIEAALTGMSRRRVHQIVAGK